MANDPHRPEELGSIPESAEAQAKLAFEHLDAALRAGDTEPSRVVSLTRFFVDVERDQDAVSRVQGDYFEGHLPTSATVEVSRLATDPRLHLEIQAIAAL